MLLCTVQEGLAQAPDREREQHEVPVLYAMFVPCSIAGC
jgi:hypothetical protein